MFPTTDGSNIKYNKEKINISILINVADPIRNEPKTNQDSIFDRANKYKDIIERLKNIIAKALLCIKNI